MSNTAGDFRAGADGGAAPGRPVHALRLEIPSDTLPAVLPELGRQRLLRVNSRLTAALPST